MTNEYVVMKGTKDGVKFILDKSAPVNAIIDAIIAKFESARDFFSTQSCTVRIENRKISDGEKLRLERRISEILPECEITVVYGEDKNTQAKVFSDTKEGYTKFYEGTVRSGRLLQSEGNLVVLGDINPGAEVIAAGNIVIMGAVRGIVHAGCTGNRNAFIVALNLSPTQIRIADIITRPPDGDEKRKDFLPEKAYIKDETIYIEEYFSK